MTRLLDRLGPSGVQTVLEEALRSDEMKATGRVGARSDIKSPRAMHNLEVDATQWQQMRDEFFARHETMSAPRIAEFTGSKSINRSARAYDWSRANKIFAVSDGMTVRYPLFQIDPETVRPFPVIKQVLDVLKDRLSGWHIAIWFEMPNFFLGERLSPLDILRSEPDRVLGAAMFEVAEMVV